MTKSNLLKVVKIAVGSTISFLIALHFNLQFSSAAAIITLLSIQDTKRETLTVFLNRTLSFFIAIVIAYIIFYAAGFHALSFGFFLLIFVFISYKIKITDGISLNAVLISHFLSTKSMHIDFILNEVWLFFIGTFVALILNLYIPTYVKEFIEVKEVIEKKMRKILLAISFDIVHENKRSSSEVYFSDLEETLSDAEEKALTSMNNTLLKDRRYYLNYVNMRKNQLTILVRIYDLVHTLTIVPNQCYDVSDILKSIGLTLNEKNEVKFLIDKLEVLKSQIRNDELPKSREEFENRAILYNVLNYLESFLLIKYEFINKLSKADYDTYLKDK